jgi:ABC-type uncharacterized transport system involved in gliding motility auxiliary subunit
MNKKLLSLAAIVFLVALFFAVNILAQGVFRSSRLDLTSDRLYTLSEGARAIARGVDEPIKIRFYFSRRAALDKPAYLSMANRVQDIIGEFARESGGKVQVSVVNPEPYSEEEEQAVQDGLEPIALSTKGDVMFFGLVGTNSTNGKQAIPQFDPRSERLLEYDLAKLLYALKNVDKKKIGVMSSVGLQTYTINPATQQPVPKQKWQVFVQLADAFDVQEVPPTATEIPAGIDVLVVVHPKQLTESALYAIDQFVMRGGRLMAFVDPQCQTDDTITAQNQVQAMMADKSSSLARLLDAWGVEVVKDQVVLDNKYAPRQQQPAEGGRIVEAVTLPFLMLKGEAISRDDDVGRALAGINMYFTGAIRRKVDFKGEALSITPLLESSEDSMLMEKSKLQFVQDMSKVMDMFNSENRRHTLAARLTGKIASAFPDGPPKGPEGSPAPDASKHLKESKGPANITLTADVDMLNDRAWGQEIQLGRSKQFVPAASNGLFFVGGVENLTGSSELLSIRPRAAGTRPFKKVDEIRTRASKDVASAQKAAEDKVAQFEQRLNDELRKRQPRADGTIEVTPDIEAKIKELQGELYQAKREVRQMYRDRDKDIDRLGWVLRALNVAAVPAVVAVVAVGLGVYRANRRSSVRRSGQN